MASVSSSYAMSAVAAAAAPRAVPRAGQTWNQVVPKELFVIVRDHLDDRDIARSMAVSRYFNDHTVLSSSQIRRMHLQWMYYVGLRPPPFRSPLAGPILAERLRVNYRINIDQSILIDAAAAAAFKDANIRLVRQLAAPLTLKEVALAIATSPQALLGLGIFTDLMRYFVCIPNGAQLCWQ